MSKYSFRNRLLSLITTGVMFVTPIAANADSNEDENNCDIDFELVQQVRREAAMTISEFKLNVQSSYEHLLPRIGYDAMLPQLQCLCYLVNRTDIPMDIQNELIESGIVFETDIEGQKMDNFVAANNILNVVADYNQSTIRHTEEIDALIDVSVLCYDENDAKLVHEMHVNYFNAHKNGTFDYEAFVKLFKQLTTLNGAEREGNASELSVGARFLAQKVYAGGAMQIIRDYLQENYTIEELSKYFDRGELLQKQWILRDDYTIDPNCQSELEVLVSYFAELWHVAYDTLYNDIFKTFEEDCARKGNK